MNHKINLDYIIFWSSILIFLVFSHKANGILTDSNDLDCTNIQCPTKCPVDSYLKSSHDGEEDDFEDYDDELLDHDPFAEEIGHFEDLPPEEELHDIHLPQHTLKERHKREVFFQEDIERCCNSQKCICNKCEKVPKCFEDHVAIEVIEGRGLPGNCCSIYKCIKKQQCQVGVKQSWWTSKCTKCSCFGENELCTQICPEEEIMHSCYSEYWQKPMMNGAFWKEGSCTSCTCEQGDRRCLTPVCPKLNCKNTIAYEDECCPKCVDDKETNERAEIIYNKEENIKDLEEESHTESFSTTDIPVVTLNKENNVSVLPNDFSFSTIDETVLNKGQTTSPLSEETSSVSIYPTTEEISATFKSETGNILEENSSSPETTAITTSTKEPKSLVEIDSSTSINTFTEQLNNEHQLYTPVTVTEDPKSIPITKLEQDITSTSGEVETSSTATAISSTTESLEEATTVKTSTTNIKEETFTETLTETSKMEKVENPSTTISSTDTSTKYSVENTDFADSSTSSNYVSTNVATRETTTASLLPFSTSAATKSNTLLESSTLKTMSSHVAPHSIIETTTNTPFEFSAVTSAPNTVSSIISTRPFTTTSSSTTSSPFFFYTTSTETPISEKSTSTSTTTAPEPLKSLYQPYGDFSTKERVPSTQNQMRIIFDEIDYMIMIALFIGSVLCIGLGLIIRHTKNRKKMYSSIPNSETSLSQTSTNTLMTV